MDNKQWSENTHESAVEGFYATGIEGFHDYHEGYLNFGYWTKPDMHYEAAAENLVRTLGEKLELHTESRLLDVGCGMGTQDIFMAGHFDPHSIDALDVTYKHIQRARERARLKGVPEEKLRFHHGTATQLPFEDNTFTHLLSIEAPEHFDTREKFFHEAFRVLKPGGVMVLADYSINRPAKKLWEKFIVDATRRLWVVPTANVYGNEVYQQKLEAAGFSGVNIENVGQWTIPGYYHEHRKPEEVKKMIKVRGVLKGVIGGFLIDYGVYKAYTTGLVEYIFVRAQKPV